MKHPSIGTRSASVLLFAWLLVPAFAQDRSAVRPAQARAFEVPFSAVIESIEFKDVPAKDQQLVLDRIGVRAGDVLSIEVRHRIGRELGQLRKGMTFRYEAGSKPGTVKLLINADC